MNNLLKDRLLTSMLLAVALLGGALTLAAPQDVSAREGQKINILIGCTDVCNAAKDLCCAAEE